MKEDKVTILGKEFKRDSIPHVARMLDTSRENAERQIQGIADAWHEGSVVSAVQALESDLAHG